MHVLLKDYIWRIILGSVHVQDYALAAAVTLGCALFALTGRVSSKAAAEQPTTSAAGVLLMLTYLAFDGFTSTWQARSLPRIPAPRATPWPCISGSKALEPCHPHEAHVSSSF